MPLLSSTLHATFTTRLHPAPFPALRRPSPTLTPLGLRLVLCTRARDRAAPLRLVQRRALDRRGALRPVPDDGWLVVPVRLG